MQHDQKIIKTLSKISSCNSTDEKMLSANIYIDNDPLNLTSFEVEILNCEFNPGFNYGTFSIEIDTFLKIYIEPFFSQDPLLYLEPGSGYLSQIQMNNNTDPLVFPAR